MNWMIQDITQDITQDVIQSSTNDGDVADVSTGNKMPKTMTMTMMMK
jgi:hypothetical protein